MYLRRGLRGIVFVASGAAAASIVGYLVRMLFAHNLSPSQFGLFYAVFSFVSLFEVLKTLGFQGVFERFIPQYLKNQEHTRIRSLIIFSVCCRLLISLLIAAILISMSDIIVQHFFGEEAARALLMFLVGYFVFSGLIVMAERLFAAFQKPAYVSALSIFRILFVFVFAVFFFWQGYSINATGLSYFWAYLALLPLCILAVIRIYPKLFGGLRLKRKDIVSWLSFGVGTYVMTTAVAVISKTDTLMLTYFRPLQDVGFYNVAHPTAGLLMFFSFALTAVFLPMASELVARGKTNKVCEGLGIIHKYVFVVVFPLLTVFLVFPDVLISYLFGKEFLAAEWSLRVLSIAFFFQVLAQTCMLALQASGKLRILNTVYWTAAICNIFLNLVLIKSLGSTGAAIATCLVFALLFFLLLRQVYLLFQYKLSARGGLLGIVGTACLFICVILQVFLVLPRWAEMLVIVPFGTLLYYSTSYLLGILPLSELKWFCRVFFQR